MKKEFRSGRAAAQVAEGPQNIVELKRAAPQHKLDIGPMGRLSVDTPKSVLATLRKAATERECTVAFLVHEALQKAGYLIPEEMIERADRRTKG